jgi:hypothetical protein
MEWLNIEIKKQNVLTAAPETLLGKGFGQELMIR